MVHADTINRLDTSHVDAKTILAAMIRDMFDIWRRSHLLAVSVCFQSSFTLQQRNFHVSRAIVDYACDRSQLMGKHDLSVGGETAAESRSDHD